MLLRVSYDVYDQGEIVEPAVQGTLNVLRSCKKNPSLRRVVLTSSSSTVRIREDIDPRVPLDESSWSSTELCERFQVRMYICMYVCVCVYACKKRQIHSFSIQQVWYGLSKILAERAAWGFCKENNIDLITVLPAFLIGPSLPPNLCSTASDVLGLFKGNNPNLMNSFLAKF